MSRMIVPSGTTTQDTVLGGRPAVLFEPEPAPGPAQSCTSRRRLGVRITQGCHGGHCEPGDLDRCQGLVGGPPACPRAPLSGRDQRHGTRSVPCWTAAWSRPRSSSSATPPAAGWPSPQRDLAQAVHPRRPARRRPGRASAGHGVHPSPGPRAVTHTVRRRRSRAFRRPGLRPAGRMAGTQPLMVTAAPQDPVVVLGAHRHTPRLVPAR